MTSPETNGSVEIPKTCKAGVVVNEGPDFHLEVEDVPVPEPGKKSPLILSINYNIPTQPSYLLH